MSLHVHSVIILQAIGRWWVFTLWITIIFKRLDSTAVGACRGNQVIRLFVKTCLKFQLCDRSSCASLDRGRPRWRVYLRLLWSWRYSVAQVWITDDSQFLLCKGVQVAHLGITKYLALRGSKFAQFAHLVHTLFRPRHLVNSVCRSERGCNKVVSGGSFLNIQPGRVPGLKYSNPGFFVSESEVGVPVSWAND